MKKKTKKRKRERERVCVWCLLNKIKLSKRESQKADSVSHLFLFFFKCLVSEVPFPFWSSPFTDSTNCYRVEVCHVR